MRTPQRSRVSHSVTLLSVLFLLFICYVSAQGDEMYSNPVFDRDFPDPDVLVLDGVYYAYATNTRGFNIQVARSHDLVSWELLGAHLDPQSQP
jgi:beta-xylosidase